MTGLELMESVGRKFSNFSLTWRLKRHTCYACKINHQTEECSLELNSVLFVPGKSYKDDKDFTSDNIADLHQQYVAWLAEVSQYLHHDADQDSNENPCFLIPAPALAESVEGNGDA